MGKQKSFTVIELLVVIAIIGLIASIVLVSLRGARQRAWIARGMHFSDSLRAGLADAIVGWWSLDEGAGNIANDPWGGNDGTISGASWTEGIIRGALSFDGSNDYVRVLHSASLNLRNAVTIEAWIRPASFGAAGDYRAIVGKQSNAESGGYELITSQDQTEVMFHIQASGAYWVSATLPEINRWYHIVGTYDKDLVSGNLEIYLNGKLIATLDHTQPIGAVVRSLYIGGDPENNSAATAEFYGLIDEVRVYNRSLTAFEIQKRYAQGLKKFKLVER